MGRCLPTLAVLVLASALWAADAEKAPEVSVPAPAAEAATTGIGPGSLNPAKRGLSLPTTPRVMVIPIKDDETTRLGMMDDWQAAFLERRLRQAEDGKYDLVILEIDTNGGMVASVERMNKALAKSKVPVLAYVTGKAFSAGAILAIGTRGIIVAPGTQIGGAKAVSMFGDVPEDHRAKLDAYMRAMVKNLAQSNNYPEAIVVGMVDSNVEVYEVSGLPQRYMTERELVEFEQKNGYKPTRVRQIKRKDELLSLTPAEAVNMGLAMGVANDLDEIFTGLNRTPGELKLAGVSAGESAARFVGHPLWRVLLVIIGIVALFWELKAPGHGIGYIVFAFCLGIFFWLQIFANNAGLLEIILFAAGALLLGLEIFVVAGFGFPGFAGIVLILASIILSFLPDSISLQSLWDGSASPEELARVRAALGWAALTLLSVVGITVAALAGGAKLPGLGRMALRAEVPAPEPMLSAAGAAVTLSIGTGQSDLVGQVGVAETVLRPSGKVRLGGRTYDAVSEGAFLDPGANVVVLRMSGNSLVVRAVS